MFTRPDDLSDREVAEVFARGWGVSVESITHRAVGFGSHHWEARATDQHWFLTVDHVGAGDHDRLRSALSTVLALKHDGHDFVVAPVSTAAGSPSYPINGHYELAAYPFVSGDHGTHGVYDTREQRLALLDCLARLHQSTERISHQPDRDELTIPCRAGLAVAMQDLVSPWETGPFAERAQKLLAQHPESVVTALGRFDELAAQADPSTFVVTHGEPHRGNVIFTELGVRMIDWDTVRFAPRERDLWALNAEDSLMASAYERRTGIALNPAMLELYQLAWDLTDIALFIDDFRRPHEQTADTQSCWQGLASSVRRLR